MSFNNNIPGTPGMPRLMRPKAVSVSPIHSPIGNVIARPVVSVMSSQGHSQFVMGTNMVQQVYQGARVAQPQPTGQPRISAQVMLPQQPRVPVQLGTHVSIAQNRPNMHGYQNVAFQNFAFPVQRTMSGQVQATNQIIFAGRMDPNSNLPVLKPAVPGMQRTFQTQAQPRYMVPAAVNVGKQFISTQNHGMMSSQVSASVLPGSVVHRHTAQIIPQTVVPMRTNQNIHIVASNVPSGSQNPVVSVTNVISQSVPYEASVSSKDTTVDTPAEVSLVSSETGSTPTVLTTSESCDLPTVENNSAGSSIQAEAVMLVDSGDTSVGDDDTTQKMSSSQPTLMVASEPNVVGENLDGTFVINTSGSSISDDSFTYTVTGDQYEHIVINPLSEEPSNTDEISQNVVSDENALPVNEAAVENTVDNDPGNEVVGEDIDNDSNENNEDNAMEVDNDNESVDQVHSAEMDGNSQDSGPALSGKTASSCLYCSDEDSQLTGVSSDIFTEDSSNMSWEKFHEKVLNLRVNKDRGKINVSDSDQSKLIDVDGDSTTVTVGEVAASDDVDKVHDDDAECNDDDTEEPDFVWESYLQQVGATAVPPSAFKHVEYSLQSCVMKGMKLEVQNKSDPTTFWVATVVMTCGPLLRLRYDGYGDDSTNDFWCDFATTEIHHIGWSAENGRNLQPPDEIKDKVEDWRSFLLESLTGAKTAPASYLEKNAGTTPVDQIRCGMMLELQDALNPLHVWLVQVLENVGGRLYLRLEGSQSSCKHFWMFYLNPRLHHVGWAKEQSNIIYRAPEDIYKEETDEKWQEILEAALQQNKDDVVPEDVFKDQPELKVHQFTVGMKLEALNPGMNQIGPATVIKVINDNYFIVEMDDVRPAEKRSSIQICCNSEYLGIFPVSWCQCKGIRMVPPPGWTNPDFVWGEYLSYCNAKAAPERLFTSGTDDHEFERGMKLEAVNPSNPNQICAATITKIVGPLLWIHLDHMRDIPSHIEDIDSHNIFPVGWAESNNYQLKPPLKTTLKKKPVTECKTEQVYRSITSTQEKGAWCPKIYFNHRCFSGPYLSKGRISDLPKHVGPGPMDLVLKEVLRLLISIAYVPCRAMKEIQQDDPPNPYMISHLVKAKYKGKKYKVMVEVCHNESQLEEFCRNICIKLECCPYLFSPLCVRDNCPENCQQLTKTKSNPSYVKKKKTGNIISSKPSTAELENREPKKRGRKRKRFLFVQKKGQQYYKSQETQKDSKDEGFIDYDDDDNGMVNSDRRGYNIETRGAKLPKYSFERKTHKKILIPQSNIHVERPVSGVKKFKPKTWSGEDQVIDKLQPREGSIKLESNPLHWSVAQVVQYIKSTDCSHLARIMKEQEVDGQAFLLMNLSAIQEHLELKLGPAVKLCHQIERLKVAFFENYA